MGPSLDKDESQETNEELQETGGSGAVYAEREPSRRRSIYSEHLNALQERRVRLLERDALGRTPLFYAAEKGLEEEVWDIIFSFRGTGLAPPRLSLITIKDHLDLTAADVAEQNGHEEIARLLRGEQGRMEFFE